MIFNQFGIIIVISLITALGLFIWLKIIGVVHGLNDLGKSIKQKIWLISLILVTLSPFVFPTTVGKSENLKVLHFGAPMKYVEQHIYQKESIRSENERVTLINRWGHSLIGDLNIRMDLYLVSIVEVYLFLYVVAVITVRLRVRDRYMTD